MKDELLSIKYHPRIMELRLAAFKMQLEQQYGEAQSMEMLQKLCEMFQCNWSLLVGIFNKDNRILNGVAIGQKRRKQEIILMGYLYDETRYHISKHYLNMSTNYLYQQRGEHNPEAYVNEDWLKELDGEIIACGVRSYAIEAKQFIVSFDNFVRVFR